MTVAALVALGACSVSPGASPSTEEERTAQDLVIDLMNLTAMNTYSQDLGAFARSAELARTSAVLVGIEKDGSGDVLGHLTFAVSLDDEMYTHTTGSTGTQPVEGWDPGPYCFRVELDPWGKTGEHMTADGVELVDCPHDTTALAPPPSTEPVVAPGAREAAHEVLAALPTTGTLVEDDVASEIDALLPTEIDGRPVSQADVFVNGPDVAVAMGRGPDDCVLVARIGGTVTDIYPPAIYLEPGEMGCGPGTALSPDLSPPH